MADKVMEDIPKEVIGVVTTRDLDWRTNFSRVKVPGDGDCFFSAVNCSMKAQDSTWHHNKISLRSLDIPFLE